MNQTHIFAENEESIKKPLDGGNSRIGVWKKMDMPVCEKFQEEGSQWKKQRGFLFCDVALFQGFINNNIHSFCWIIGYCYNI